MKKNYFGLLLILLSSCSNVIIPSNPDGESIQLPSNVISNEIVGTENKYESNCIGKVFFESNFESISIDNLSVTNQIIFGCKQDDNSGRIKIGSSNEYEKMTLSITGKVVTNFEKLTCLSIKFEQIGKENNILEKQQSNLYLASQFIYGENKDCSLIVLPNCYYNEVILYKNDGNEYSNFDLINNSFSYEISFDWGSIFEGINPGYYYDGLNKYGESFASDDIEGKGISERGLNTPIPSIINSITNLNKTIYGENQDDEQQKILNSRYLVTISTIFE